MSRRSFQKLYVVVCILAFAPVMFPVFEIANSATPIVVGLPLNFLWVVAWVLIVALCAVVLYRIDPENRAGGEE
jgi:TRAP-type C4-dicarboxylate transport system permease small subunit